MYRQSSIVFQIRPWS